MASGIATESWSPPTTEPLTRLRAGRGLSREVLAAMAGLSPRTLYAIEREGVRPQRATCHVLADALGCSPGDLTNDESPARQPGSVKTSAGTGRHGSP